MPFQSSTLEGLETYLSESMIAPVNQPDLINLIFHGQYGMVCDHVPSLHPNRSFFILDPTIPVVVR